MAAAKTNVPICHELRYLEAVMLCHRKRMWTADVNDLNIFAFDLHRPSYLPFYKMTAVGTTTSRLKLCPISFNNYDRW